MVAGIRKPTRRVAPRMVVTAVATVAAEGPAPGVAGCRVTVTLAAGIVPLGYPDPRIVIEVTPGCPAPGEVAGLSVTLVCPHAGIQETTSAPRNTATRATARTDCRGLPGIRDSRGMVIAGERAMEFRLQNLLQS